MQINFGSLMSTNKNYNCKNQKSYNKYPNLAPLTKDTVSFGSKKTDFDEFDLFIQKKFAVAYSRFKNNKEFQDCCNLELERYYNKDYSARSEHKTIDRIHKLDEWFNYLKTGNDAYTPAMKLLIIDGITKNLKNNNDNEPLLLNPGALADTMTQIQDKVKNGQINNINFLNLYKTQLNNVNNVQIVNDKGENT